MLITILRDCRVPVSVDCFSIITPGWEYNQAMPYNQDPELLQAALIGLQHKLSEIERHIAELRGQLGGQPAAVPAPEPGVKKRTMSAAARRRIALAQKKRWAAYKADHGKPAASKPSAAPKPAKRVMSAEGRARIVAATKKRWAAFRKAQKAAQAPVKKAAPKKVARKTPPAAPAPEAPAAAPAAE